MAGTLELTACLAAAYVRFNVLEAAKLPALLKGIHDAFLELGRDAPPPDLIPAVKISQSVHRDYVVCLEDGKRFTMLKRHLRAAHGMSTVAYRERWGLPPRHALVAPSYAEQRSLWAKQSRLGQRRRRTEKSG
jgi:predicted transcriptional regulator